MCLKDPLLVGEQKGKQVMQLTLPKSIKPDKAAVAKQMLLPLAECSTGGEACAILLSDLLCGEALSPTTTTYCHHQFGELHYDSIATTSAVRGWLVNVISASIPYPAHGSSFLSKSKENLCSMNINQLNSFSHTDDTATNVARKDPPPETVMVGADSVSNTSLVDLGEAMRVLQEREVTTPHRLTDRYINTLIWSDLDDNKSYVGLGMARREGVFLIFKLVEDLGLRIVIGAHAIAYLDRFLSTMTSSLANSQVDETSATHFPYIAAACVLIAAKMDDTAAPSLASLCKFSSEGYLIEGKLRDVEVVVLQVLGWKLLAVTTSDFVDNMLAHLPLIGVSSALVQGARSRADELLQAILTEVEFLDFEQSTIGLCVMQCILDETLPLQAALLMAALQTFLVVDMVFAVITFCVAAMSQEAGGFGIRPSATMLLNLTGQCARRLILHNNTGARSRFIDSHHSKLGFMELGELRSSARLSTSRSWISEAPAQTSHKASHSFTDFS